MRSGSIHFEGRDLTALNDAQLRELWGNDIAMVFQDPMTSLNPVMKIGKQITESLRFHLDMSEQDAKETAVALLRAVGIPEPDERFDAYPHEMSGGMRQRVIIAIALACGPKLLMADEPTTALDVTVQAQILDLLAEQQRERYMAMILVTHDLGCGRRPGRRDRRDVRRQDRREGPDHRCSSARCACRTPRRCCPSIPSSRTRSHTRLMAIGGRPPDLVNPPKGCSFSPRCPYAQ